MGICTRCGYITADGEFPATGEVHECNPAYVKVAKKSWEMAVQESIKDNLIEIDQDGKPKEKGV